MENLPNDVIINNITEFRNIIIQQKNYVDEVQLLILRKDELISNKDAEIQLRDTTITNLEQVITNKDAEIQLRDTTITTLEQVISNKDAEIQLRDTTITTLEQVISNKEDKFKSIDNIKKKYLKKELEIYKNENISLKSQNDFFKNLFMMNNMLKSNEYIYNYHQHPSLHNQHPSLHNQLPSLHQQTGESHRSNVKPVENSKLNNNENQHKNNMGCVLQQLSQKLKEKNKE